MTHTKRWDKWGPGGREEDRLQDRQDKFRKRRNDRNRRNSLGENPTPLPALERGKIHKINFDKGFGFITPERGSKSIFFHMSVLHGDLEFVKLVCGDRVKYQAKMTDRGMQATIVLPV